MAIFMRQDVPGVTVEQFNQLFEPLIAQIQAFPGFVSHASGATAEGYLVTEVWESQEAHERWRREVIMPILKRMGMEQIPPSQYMPLNRQFAR